MIAPLHKIHEESFAALAHQQQLDCLHCRLVVETPCQPSTTQYYCLYYCGLQLTEPGIPDLKTEDILYTIPFVIFLVFSLNITYSTYLLILPSVRLLGLFSHPHALQLHQHLAFSLQHLYSRSSRSPATNCAGLSSHCTEGRQGLVTHQIGRLLRGSTGTGAGVQLHAKPILHTKQKKHKLRSPQVKIKVTRKDN